MDEIPKLKKNSDRKPINIMIDKEIDELYRLAKQNGHNSSEIARRVVTAEFKRLAQKLMRPAS